MGEKFYELEPGLFVFDCPGCKYSHDIKTKGPAPVWSYNHDKFKPTLSPSVLVNGRGHGIRCHSFIKEGMIQFLADCDHELAGQTVELPDHDWGDYA